MPWASQEQQQHQRSAQKKTSQCQQQQQQQLPIQVQQHAQQCGPDQTCLRVEQTNCVPTPGTSGSAVVNQHQPVSQQQQQRQNKLPNAVYNKLRQVNQQISTLSGNAINSGFSARILDRGEYRVQGGDITVVQLVEITKKPGQSLGLYLREGNGIDRFTGVFASRYGENSELERFGDIVRPGDEILNVNNVEVSAMSIDDVVLMLSIPRRLVLRIKYMKNRRETYGTNESCEQRPVIVFQKSLSDEQHQQNRHQGHHHARCGSNYNNHNDNNLELSSVNKLRSEAASSGALLKPTSTASTWLGKCVRQQQQEQQKKFSYWKQQASHLTGQKDSSLQMPHMNQQTMQPSQHWMAENPCISNDSTTLHRLRYPLSEQLGVRRRHPAYMMNSSTVTPNISDGMTPLITRRPMTTVGVPSNNSVNYGYSTNIYEAKSQSANQPFMWPTPYSKSIDLSYKSNSLPRRRFQSNLSTGTMQNRSVKWRNDVLNTQTPDIYKPIIQDSTSDVAFQPAFRCHPFNESTGRTIADIFSAEEYKNWAGTGDETMSEIGQSTTYRHRSRGFDNVRTSYRSSSLPSKAILRNNLWEKSTGIASAEMKLPMHNKITMNTSGFLSNIPKQHHNGDNFNVDISKKYASGVFDRLHISPMINRRVSLRTLGSGFDVDRLSINALSGILSISIVEGNNLKVPDKLHSKQLYVVVEVNEVHRARTGISVPEQMFRWNESFDIDVYNATEAQFFIYAWHPKLRHLFCHKGCMRLLDAFFLNQLDGNQIFTLNMEPSGHLLVRVTFIDMAQAYMRKRVNLSSSSVTFGCALEQVLQREKSETPIALTRLIREIEDRGVDSPGLYYLCAATERKSVLRNELDCDARTADLSVSPAPDINLLACLVKDYLRELPQPLVPLNIYTMLIDAEKVFGGTESSATEEINNNQQFVLRIIDCIASPNKKTLLLVMDHLRNLLLAEPHNGLTSNRISMVFGPLIFCTTNYDQIQDCSKTESHQNEMKVNSLSITQATKALKLLLEFWPSRVNTSESNSLCSAK